MKIGLLITARLKSTRLPLKLLSDLNGKTVIERVIERAKKIHNVDNIVLCTSTNRQDKPLTDIALKNNIHYYLGSEEDVLQRLSDASSFFGFDYILSITGENPLYSIEHANQVVDLLIRDEPDFTYLEGLPIGCAVSGIKVKALQVVCEVKKIMDTEIWGPLINRPEIFDVQKIEVDNFYRRPKLRITNDYFEDYQFLNEIGSHFSSEEIPSLFSVLSLLDEHPEYLEIHKDKKQENLSKDFLEKLDTFFSKNKERIIKVKQSFYND